MSLNIKSIIQKVEKDFSNEKIKTWDFNIGDTINVHYKIVEGKKEKVQVFKGVVLFIQGSGLNKSVCVRKISSNISVERIFPLHSPFIKDIELVFRGRVRRAKLYYLRSRFGKSAQVKKLKVNYEKKKSSL